MNGMMDGGEQREKQRQSVSGGMRKRRGHENHATICTASVRVRCYNFTMSIFIKHIFCTICRTVRSSRQLFFIGFIDRTKAFIHATVKTKMFPLT